MSSPFSRSAACLALGIVLLAPLSAQAQNLCRPPGDYLGNNVYVQRGVGITRYYYWTGVPGTVPVLIRKLQTSQSVTTVTPTLPLVPGLPPTIVQNTTTQTTVVETPVPPIPTGLPRPIGTPVVTPPLLPRPVAPVRSLYPGGGVVAPRRFIP